MKIPDFIYVCKSTKRCANPNTCVAMTDLSSKPSSCLYTLCGTELCKWEKTSPTKFAAMLLKA